ncbi:helix-turn-helix domain-containing protein [Vibrio sp. Isolate34]|uniref:helix-turn-helix domain-containing protein n=1 Tax=Vibrio sp. Isolate34 TaxID=2908540 RepID=UPI001EFDAE80|nr:helix-turn-helix domain-containing protein [Vibrio sp. Isolate34]MCG9639526.1 helix-turn-helix domain-containing protein [Vibrio sp. Isolate34]
MCVSLILSFMPMKTGSPISKLVLLKLADNADARGVCFPSLNYLAQYCEVSVRTVKRHVNELEKQGFVKRIKRFDDSGRQRSNIYQLRLPGGCHIEQADLNQADRGLDQTDHSDTPLGDSRSNTESDHLSHIIFHKEHKTDITVETHPVVEAEKALETAPTLEAEPPLEAARSFEKELAIPPAKGAKPTSQQNEAVIHLLTKEGNAPIYHEFYKILERTYPKLDVLQELHAMQTWLYINPDKRKPFEHIGHFVNGWLRRSAKAKAQIKTQTNTEQGASPTFKQTGASKPTSASASAKSRKAEKSGATANPKQFAKPVESQQPTPVTQALADYKAKSTTNPFEARIKALVQSKSSSADSKQ